MRVSQNHVTVLNSILRFRFLFRGLKISERIRITCFFLCSSSPTSSSFLHYNARHSFSFFALLGSEDSFSLVVVCGKSEEDFSVRQTVYDPKKNSVSLKTKTRFQESFVHSIHPSGSTLTFLSKKIHTRPRVR